MYQPNNPYQNSGVPMPNNFVNPNNPYLGYYQQVPYTQNNMMNMNNQPQPVRVSIAGRMIGNISEIVPNEVPMDGSVSFFPQSDYSCIYAKKWNTDGTIQTVKFVPVVEDTSSTQTSTNDFNTSLAADISEISERLSKIEAMLSANKGASRAVSSAKEASK